MVVSQKDPEEKSSSGGDLGSASQLMQPQEGVKPAWVRAAENPGVRVIRGNIADCDTEALFFLNLKDTEFPAPGPVIQAILDRDRQINTGRTIKQMILDAVRDIPDARLVADDGDGDPYDKAVFSSRPYAMTRVDVEEAKWPHLKKIFFGNIGADDGVLVQTVMGWADGNEADLIRKQPELEPLFKQLRREIGILLNNCFDLIDETGLASVGMPLLTGNRAPSPVFYDVLDKVVKERRPKFEIQVYSRDEGASQ